MDNQECEAEEDDVMSLITEEEVSTEKGENESETISEKDCGCRRGKGAEEKQRNEKEQEIIQAGADDTIKGGKPVANEREIVDRTWTKDTNINSKKKQSKNRTVYTLLVFNPFTEYFAALREKKRRMHQAAENRQRQILTQDYKVQKCRRVVDAAFKLQHPSYEHIGAASNAEPCGTNEPVDHENIESSPVWDSSCIINEPS